MCLEVSEHMEDVTNKTTRAVRPWKEVKFLRRDLGREMTRNMKIVNSEFVEVGMLHGIKVTIPGEVTVRHLETAVGKQPGYMTNETTKRQTECWAVVTVGEANSERCNQTEQKELKGSTRLPCHYEHGA